MGKYKEGTQITSNRERCRKTNRQCAIQRVKLSKIITEKNARNWVSVCENGNERHHPCARTKYETEGETTFCF